MTGAFVCIVGPSGAGKDTLIDGVRGKLAGDPAFSFPRRLVTREASAAEDHDTVSPAAFQAMRHADAFALSWSAHSLGYAIPISARHHVDEGRVVVCNISRGAIAEAREKFALVCVVLVTAPHDVLLDRLVRRGRESAARVEARLSRDVECAPASADLVITNVGSIENNVGALLAFLQNLARG